MTTDSNTPSGSSSMARAEETAPSQDVRRRIAALMGFEAATLAVMSSLHLSGALRGGSPPFRPTDAGIAEAIICLALAYGAAELLRRSRHARTTALATTSFAIVGFIVGLSFTVRGGDAIDIAYHATVLPLLLLTLVALLRTAQTPQVQIAQPADPRMGQVGS